MGGLTAAIAHEVNQPLCAIVANASAALRWLGSDRPDVSQVREALTDVVCDGKRASELIRRTRGLFERRELERRPVDLNSIVHSALALTRGALEAGRVVVRTELDPTLPLVRADQVQLQQVFCNLVINAVEAMARVAGGEQTLQIITRHQEGSAIHATVIDTGEGFGGDDPERVFQAARHHPARRHGHRLVDEPDYRGDARRAPVGDAERRCRRHVSRHAAC